MACAKCGARLKLKLEWPRDLELFNLQLQPGELGNETATFTLTLATEDNLKATVQFLKFLFPDGFHEIAGRAVSVAPPRGETSDPRLAEGAPSTAAADAPEQA